MKILHALEEITDGEPRVFVLGFDGCHLGHQAVFKEAAKLAEEKSAGIGVITFYPHPMSVLAPGIRVLFSSQKRKRQSPSGRQAWIWPYLSARRRNSSLKQQNHS